MSAESALWSSTIKAGRRWRAPSAPAPSMVTASAFGALAQGGVVWGDLNTNAQAGAGVFGVPAHPRWHAVFEQVQRLTVTPIVCVDAAGAWLGAGAQQRAR